MQDIFEELNKLYESEEQDSIYASDEEYEEFLNKVLNQITAENKEIYIDKVNEQWELEDCDVELSNIWLKGDMLAGFLADRGIEDIIIDYFWALKNNKEDITKEELKNFNLDDFLNWYKTEKKNDIIDYYYDSVEKFVSHYYEWGYKDTFWRDCDFEIRDAEYYENEWADWAIDAEREKRAFGDEDWW